MIEIAQAGQAGKTQLLFDMHRLRTRVFKDRLGWDVKVGEDGLEVDEFDVPEAVYLLALDGARRVIGGWRLLCATGPTMIARLWPQCLESLPMPQRRDVFEVSRFAVHSLAETAEAAAAETRKAVAEMFCGLTELCLRAGITEVHTLYDDRIAKIIRRLDCVPEKTSAPLEISGVPCRTGVFRTDAAMLARLRAATGIAHDLTGGLELPPALAAPGAEV